MAVLGPCCCVYLLWLSRVSVAACRLCLVGASGRCSPCRAVAPVSEPRPRAHSCSGYGLQAPEHGFNSRRASLLRVGSSGIRDWTHVSCMSGQIPHHWAARGSPQRLLFFKVKCPPLHFPFSRINFCRPPLHTHAFPLSCQHSVGTWILNRYCTFPYSFLAFKKKTFPACSSTSGVWNEMRASQCWVCEGQRILFCWWKDFHRLSDMVLRHIKSGEWAVVCPEPLDWTLCHVFKISFETKPSIRVRAFPFPEVLSADDSLRRTFPAPQKCWVSLWGGGGGHRPSCLLSNFTQRTYKIMYLGL